MTAVDAILPERAVADLHNLVLHPFHPSLPLSEPTAMAKRMRRNHAHHAALLEERARHRSSTTTTDDDSTTSSSQTTSTSRRPAAAATTTDNGDDDASTTAVAATAVDTVAATTASLTSAVVTTSARRISSTTPTTIAAFSSSAAIIPSANLASISASPSSTTAPSGTSGLSTGAIGGIAFGAVVGAFALCYGAWRYRHRAVSRHHDGPGGFGGSFGYQRHDDYSGGSGGGGLRRGDKDHQSFGNIAGMGEDLGMGPIMTEKGVSHAHIAGMTRDQWDDAHPHDPRSAVLPPLPQTDNNVAGVGSARPTSQAATVRPDHASAYYNQPGGHLSSYYGTTDGVDYSAPVPPVPAKYGAAAQQEGTDDARASIGAMLAMGAIGGGAAASAAALGKPLSVVKEEDEDHQNRYSGNAQETLNAAAVMAGQEEQTPFADPPEHGKTFIVRRTFEPSMNDELTIFPGDRIQILTSYDDGWCLGINLDAPSGDPSRPNRGVFPRDCVEELTGASSLQRVPTLPPLDLGDDDTAEGDRSADRVMLGFDPPLNNTPVPNTPAIEVSPAVDDHAPANRSGGLTPSGSSPKLDKLQRRASSLIASRDAELFMALGAALDARDAQRK